MMQFKADDVVMIGEFGALIVQKEGTLKVAMVSPRERRPKETADADIAIGDEVGMANGKRVKSAKELRALYDSAQVGAEFKLGLRRDGQPHIVTFAKKDQKDLPGRMVIQRQGDDNADLFPALGIGLEKKGDEVVVSETLPNAPREIHKGDAVKSLNGKPVKAVADFSKEFDATPLGDKLTFELLRDGKSVTVVTTRPEPRRQIITR